MTHVKQLKETLDASFTNYTRHYAALRRSVDGATTSMTELKSKINKTKYTIDPGISLLLKTNR